MKTMATANQARPPTVAIELSLLSERLTCVSEIPVAEQCEKKGEHENGEERDLAPGKQKPEQG